MSQKNKDNAFSPAEHSEIDERNTNGYGSYHTYGGDAYGYGKGLPYGGGYKEGYPGYHGYGYSDNEAAQAAHSLRDYLLMVSERWPLLIFAILTCTFCGLIYIANRTPEYLASSKMRIFRRPYATAALTQGTLNPDTDSVWTQEDLQTQIEMMKSSDIVRRVLNRMPAELREAILKPYQDGNVFSGPLTPEEVATACRGIIPQRGTLMVDVTYFHPDPVVAISMANYFAQEIRDYAEESRYKQTSSSLERGEFELQKIDGDLNELYRKKSELVAKFPQLQTRTDATGHMASLLREIDAKVRARATEHQERLDLLKQIEEIKKTSANRIDGLKESFKDIAVMSDVLYNAGQVTAIKTRIAGLLERYTEEHQQIKIQRRELQGFEEALAQAIKDAEAKLRQESSLAAGRLEIAEKERDQINKENVSLQQAQIEYADIIKQTDDKERQRQSMRTGFEMERLKLTGGQLININIQESGRLVQIKAINKDYWKGGGLGLLAGTALGLALVFALATLDDRIKSADDIERFLGLQLIGILPTVHRFDVFTKAKLASTGKDIPTTEAFRTLYSALRISNNAQKARILLTTSTSPSEGKSFVTTNIAMTYARQGERVLIIDADLRMPVIAETLKLDEEQGILPYLRGTSTLEQSIHYEYLKNLDVLPAGRIRKNEDPTRLLNSQEFADMLLTLRTCYDRIFVDSPPIGAVSDVLNLIPKVDGILYVIRFNSVRKRFIAASLNRLKETRIPVFGGILNQISMRSVRYYTNADDRAYNRYYAGTDTKRKQAREKEGVGETKKKKNVAKTRKKAETPEKRKK